MWITIFLVNWEECYDSSIIYLPLRLLRPLRPGVRAVSIMMNASKCGIHCVAWWLLWVGGINWGLVGLLDWNLVDTLFGGWPWLVKLVYILVGISALLVLLEKKCTKCK